MMDQKLRRDAELRANSSDRAIPPSPSPYSVRPAQIPPQYYSSPPPIQLNPSIHWNSSVLPYNDSQSSSQESPSMISSNTNAFQGQPQPQPQQHHREAPNDSTTTDDIATKARQEWQQYGRNKTQILEDLRYGRYCPTNQHHPWKIGKVIRAEERVDIAGAPYTTYIIHIWDRSVSSAATTTTTHDAANPNVSSIKVIERRYSEFCKLYHALVVRSGNDTPTPSHQHCQYPHQQQRRDDNNASTYVSYSDWYDAIQSIFPSKHWTGRLGNWTPAKYMAPQQYHNTIQERIQSFDAWFVHVLYAYNIYPQQQVQQQSTTSACWIPFLSEEQNSIVHDYITNPSPPPPYMIRNSSSPCEHDGSFQGTRTTNITATTTTGTHMLQYHNPVTFTLSSAIRQATTTIQIMTQQQMQNQNNSHSNNNNINSSGKSKSTAMSTPTTIPIDLLHIAMGIVFLTVAKLGMIVSGRVGTGLFIAKRPTTSTKTTTTPTKHCHNHHGTTSLPPATPASSWSAPVAVGTIGLGWGAVVGGDVTHYMIVFTTEEAVRDFGRNHTVNLGTELGISIGPTGMAASQQIQSKSKNFLEYHSTYAYAISSGLFLGVSLEGSMISIRHDVNAKFYGQTNVSVTELLRSPGVPAAEALYDALDVAIRQEVPEHALFKISRFLQTDDDLGSVG